MSRFRLIAVSIAVAAVGVQAQQLKPEDQQKYRKAAYTLMGYSLGHLESMADGKRPFARDEATRQAELLANLAQVPKAFFGEGTDKGETRARPEIWTNRADFDKKMTAMVEETAKLARTARTAEAGALKKAVGEVDDACKACHDDYRVKRRG